MKACFILQSSRIDEDAFSFEAKAEFCRNKIIYLDTCCDCLPTSILPFYLKAPTPDLLGE
jgi:hypothetical protein